MDANDLSLRLNPSFYDDFNQSIYVDVEMKYDGAGTFTLADQNYRLYFDSELLTLNEEMSRSDLPTDLYSKVQFLEILEGLEAGIINELPFDDDLGFINFTIDLQDSRDGGLEIREEDEWQRVAVLNFKVKDASSLSQIVWSTNDKTERYATAFVEIMEWLAPNHTEPVQVQEFIDASFNASGSEANNQVNISPNPADDFITLSLERNLRDAQDVAIYDVTGKKVLTSVMFAGVNERKMDITELSPGTYTLEMSNEEKGGQKLRSHFIKIEG